MSLENLNGRQEPVLDDKSNMQDEHAVNLQIDELQDCV